jgi:hypothetical protein
VGGKTPTESTNKGIGWPGTTPITPNASSIESSSATVSEQRGWWSRSVHVAILGTDRSLRTSQSSLIFPAVPRSGHSTTPRLIVRSITGGFNLAPVPKKPTAVIAEGILAGCISLN